MNAAALRNVALKQHHEYVLPARFDNTRIPGLLDTVYYLDLRELSPNDLADNIEAKLGPVLRENFLPPHPDRLFDALKAKSAAERRRRLAQAQIFFDSWIHLKAAERRIIIEIVSYGCFGEMPEYLHIGLDRLERYTGLTARQIKRVFPLIRDAGFGLKLRMQRTRGMPPMPDVTFRYVTLNVGLLGDDTEFAVAMLVIVLSHYCAEHGRQALMRADFAKLSSANRPESHAA